MSKVKGSQDVPESAGARKLPVVTIDGRRYFMDERLREYRAVDNPHIRIPIKD